MPKLTRDDMFRAAMTDFMLSFDVNEEPNVVQLYSIQTHELVNKTVNKTRCEHEYELIVPKERLIGYRDITSDINSTEVLWEGSEPLYLEQEVPTLSQFIESFNAYFNEYKTYIHRSLVSYMEIMNIPNQNSIADHTIHLKVVYHKTHCPFPRPLTNMEEKENEIRFLKSKIETKVRKLNMVRRLLTEDRDRAVLNYKRMQMKFRALYSAENKFEDCPVCYDQIMPEQLIIPGCFHYICHKCVVKCDSCPLCRDEYDHYIENED